MISEKRKEFATLIGGVGMVLVLISFGILLAVAGDIMAAIEDQFGKSWLYRLIPVAMIAGLMWLQYLVYKWVYRLFTRTF